MVNKGVLRNIKIGCAYHLIKNQHKQRLPNVDRSEYIVYQLLLGCTAGMVESDIFVEEVS